MEVGEMEFHIHPHDPCTAMYVLTPGSHRSTIPPAWLPPAFLFTHMLVVHRSEGGGIYCLGSGEPWKLHYDIKGAAPAAGPAGTRLRYGTIFMKWQGTTR